MVELREHQVAAIAALENAVRNGRLRNMVVLPTGTGKTITGLAYGQKKGGRMLWLAHRDELISQPFAALERGWPGVRAGVVKADRDERLHPIVFGSIASVAQPKRLESDWGEPFSLIVIDEAHHAAGGSYQRVLERFAPRGGTTEVLGLTATPKRADGKALDTTFDGIAYCLTIARAVEKRFLVPAQAERVVLESLDLERMVEEAGAGDFDQEALGKELLRAGAADAVARIVAERAAERRTVVFTCSVDQAMRTAEALTARGIPADWVSGERPIRERRAVLAAHREGRIKALANCAVLTEGYDDPTIDCVVVARPTRSAALYIQMAGRGLRIADGKSTCLIIDLVGVHEVCGLASVATLAGKDANEGLNADVIERTDAETAVATGRGADELLRSFLALATAVGSAGDIGQTKAAWVKVRDDLWAVDLGREGGTVCVREVAAGVWLPEILRKGSAGPDPFEAVFSDADPREDLSIEAVRERVEAFAGKQMWRRQASWRQAPATAGHLAALAKWHVKAIGNLTGGQASDLLLSRIVCARYRAVPVLRISTARSVLAILAENNASLRPGPDGNLLLRGGAALPKHIKDKITTLKPELLALLGAQAQPTATEAAA